MGRANQQTFRNFLRVSVAVGAVVAATAGHAYAADDRTNSANTAVAEVIVTGTNIKGQATVVPVRQITSDEFERGGYLDVGQALRTLPQNFGGGINQATYATGPTADRTGNNISGIASANLLGLGSGATLTLLNGMRLPAAGEGLAVDLAIVPVAAIDRVDVLADGASAIYGADAVAGVVNIITRRKFDGLETRARYGAADGGLETYDASMLAGQKIGSLSVLGGVEYFSQNELSATKRKASQRAPLPWSLVPETKRTSYFTSAQYDATPDLQFHADGMYMERQENLGLSSSTFSTTRHRKGYEYAFSAGATAQLGTWTADLFGTASGNTTKSLAAQTNRVTGVLVAQAPASNPFDRRNKLNSVEAKASGPILSLPGGDVDAAFGAAYREESLDSRTDPTVPSSRSVYSAYGELRIPVVGPGNALPLVENLVISAAGRYDDYSDAGDVFVPKVGIHWKPSPDVSVAGSFSKSFRAPSPYDLSSNYAANAVQVTDTAGTTRALYLTGTGRSLRPERSDNYSLNLTYRPRRLEGLEISVSGVHIKYTNRITAPDPSAIYFFDIRNAPAQVLIRAPSAAEVTSIVSGAYFFGGQYPASSITAIVDARSANISSTIFEGVQTSAKYGIDTSRGRVSVNLDVAHIVKFTDRLLPTSNSATRVDTIYSPTDWRSRFGVRWQARRWATSLDWNFTDSYTDNRVIAAPTKVGSLSTFDGSVSYDFDSNESWARGVRLIISATNLLNEAPPTIAIRSTSSPFSWDPTNASVVGRFISIQLIKTW